MTLTLFDILLAVGFAAFVGLSARRKLSGFINGLAALLLFRPLLAIFDGNLYVALILALVAGVLLGLGCRFLPPTQRSLDIPLTILGGVGGTFLGVLLILVSITSLPLGRNVNNQISYPSAELSTPLLASARRSPLVEIGRDIVLYPLLEPAGQITEGSKGMYRALHGFLVIGRPWERS